MQSSLWRTVLGLSTHVSSRQHRALASTPLVVLLVLAAIALGSPASAQTTTTVIELTIPRFAMVGVSVPEDSSTVAATDGMILSALAGGDPVGPRGICRDVLSGTPEPGDGVGYTFRCDRFLLGMRAWYSGSQGVHVRGPVSTTQSGGTRYELTVVELVETNLAVELEDLTTDPTATTRDLRVIYRTGGPEVPLVRTVFRDRAGVEVAPTFADPQRCVPGLGVGESPDVNLDQNMGHVFADPPGCRIESVQDGTTVDLSVPADRLGVGEPLTVQISSPWVSEVAEPRLTDNTASVVFDGDGNRRPRIRATSSITFGDQTFLVNKTPALEDQSVLVDLRQDVFDAETGVDDLTYTITAPPSWPSDFREVGPGQYLYTPRPHFTLDDSFAYTVTDRGAPDGCDVAEPDCEEPLTSGERLHQIVVDGTGDVPEIYLGGTSEFAAGETRTVNFQVTDHLDSEPEHQGRMTVQDVSCGDEAMVVNGTFEVEDWYQGESMFGSFDCAFSSDGTTTTIAITVDEEGQGTTTVRRVVQDTTSNDPPSVEEWRDVVTLEDEPVEVDLTAITSDPQTPDDALTYEIVTGPAHGTISPTGTGVLTYTPEDDFEGRDQITVRVTDDGTCSDGSAGCPALASRDRNVFLTVVPVPDPSVVTLEAATPVPDQQQQAEGSSFAAIGIGSGFGIGSGQVFDLGFTFSDLDLSTQFHTTSFSCGPGAVALGDFFTVRLPGADGNAQASGMCGSLPGATSTTISFTIFDGSPGTTGTTIFQQEITFAPVNGVPAGTGTTVEGMEDESVQIDLAALVTDDETAVDDLTFAVADQPAAGTVTLDGATATYTPDQDINGADGFTFTATDRGKPDGCDPATGAEVCAAPATSAPIPVTIDVAPVDDPPTVTLDGPGAVANRGTGTYRFTATNPDAGEALVLDDIGCGTGTLLPETFAAEATPSGINGVFDCRFPGGPGSTEVGVTVSDGTDPEARSTSANVAVQIGAPPASSPGPGAVALADLATTVSPATATTPAGEPVALAFTVTNDGPDAAAATVDVLVPEDVSIEAVAGCDPVAAGIRCSLGELVSGAETTVRVNTVHDAVGEDQVTGVASSAVTDADPTDDQATATVTVTAAVVDPAEQPEGLVEHALAVSRERFADAAAGVRTRQASPRLASWVVLARSDVFADALTGSVLTGDGPLLFTERDGLPEEVASEIDRVLGESGTVYLLGGEAAVSAPVEDALTTLGHDVVRLAGDSRVETAVAVASEARRRLGGTGVGLARAFGTTEDMTAAWADSVAGGGWAAATGSPILLTPTDVLHPAVADWLSTDAGGEAVTVLGGTAAIAETVTAELEGHRRVEGPERASTAVEIARQLRDVQPDGARSYLLVNGFAEDGWAFGLLAAGLSADGGAPVLLTGQDTIPPATAEEVTSCADEPVALRRVGSATQIADAVMQELDALDTGPC